MNQAVKNRSSPSQCPTPCGSCLNILMQRDAREFIRSTTTLLDHVLTKLTQDEQRELLEELLGEIAQRLDARAEMMEV